jgi:hypothetical protein
MPEFLNKLLQRPRATSSSEQEITLANPRSPEQELPYLRDAVQQTIAEMHLLQEESERLKNSLYSVVNTIAEGWLISEQEAQILKNAIPNSIFSNHSILSITMTDETQIQPLIDQLTQIENIWPKKVIIIHGYNQTIMDKIDPNWIFDGKLDHLYQHEHFPILIIGQRIGGPSSGSLCARLKSSSEAVRSRNR